MGTSRSFRSPPTPRWHSVLAHIANDEPHNLIRAELFNASVLDGWSAELGRPGIATYVQALVEAHEHFAGAIRSSRRPEEAIENVVSSTRDRALREDAAPSLAIAERAFARTLISTVRGVEPLATAEPAQAATNWEQSRGTPAALIGHFLGQVLHQFTCHVVARDAGQIVGKGAYEGTRAARILERSLARDAQQVGTSIRVSGSAADLPGKWSSLVDEAFRRAAAPPATVDG